MTYDELKGALDLSYAFSFSEDEFLNQNPDERLRQQFAEDPLWGGR